MQKILREENINNFRNKKLIMKSLHKERTWITGTSYNGNLN